MNLKSKLQRLGSPHARGEGSRAAPAAPASPDDQRAATLARLRRELTALAHEPRGTSHARADVGRVEVTSDAPLVPLAFVAEAEPAGTVHRRCVRLPPSHHVGRMPSDAARAVAMPTLALLALDPTLAEVDPARLLFLDTETTGLAGSGTVAFLIGLAWFDADGRLQLEQLLLRSPGEERALLDVLTARVEASSALVTFNGKSFDLPTLATRAVMNHRARLPARPHLDLLHVARRVHRARLTAFRLTALERDVLGFVRGEDIDGAEVPARYSHYLRTGDEEAIRAVVDHNAWDVVSMAALVGLYGEPLDTLRGEDLIGVARTLRRAGALSDAERAADRALELGAGPEARRVRGEVARARGDRARSLAEFEALAREAEDDEVRLELAKLYEHWVKAPLAALDVTLRGTGESEERLARRRARLARKVERRG